MKIKKIISMLLIAGLVSASCIVSGSVMSGCSKKEQIKLVMWTPADDYELMVRIASEFEDVYSDEADIEVIVQEEAISGAKKLMLNDQGTVADVFRIADDQVSDFMAINSLCEISYDKDSVIKDCGGVDSPIVKIVMKDDKLYAYPVTNSNGYFLYYNKKYFSKEEVGKLDDILDICEKNGKKFLMEWASGWYTYAFFAGAGKSVTVSEDGTHNVCDFNSNDGEYAGIDIAKAMEDIATREGFLNAPNESVGSMEEEGDMIAVVSGVWHQDKLKELWGEENLGATKLPTYTINGNQVQMASFAGYTYYGVNNTSKNKEWAQKLAAYMTSYDVQLRRFEYDGDCPANVSAASSDDIQNSPAIAALNEQSKYATIQNVLEQYYDPMSILGTYLAAKNPDETDLQELLDKTVEQIEADK